MTETFNNGDCRIRRIRSKEICIEGISVRYSLYEIELSHMRAQYAIAVSTDDDECFAALGYDRAVASSLCDDIISGGVLPCTLHDIVSDRQKEEYYLC